MCAFTVSDAAAWAEGHLYGPDVPLCRAWRNDSREIESGDAFVALRGENMDGHLYVHKAVERGAKVLLVDETHYEELGLSAPDFAGVSVIAVRNSENALTAIAKAYLEKIPVQVVGITGSVGKTTTRELSVAILKRKYRVHSAIRSFNTVIGCSLTILAMPEESEILVLELGTNHFGEIDEMVSLFPPELAVITEVAPAHLKGFGDIEGVLRAKMEICSSARIKALVFNADNALLKKAVSDHCHNMRMIGVGESYPAVLKICNTETQLSDSGARLSIRYNRNGAPFEVEAALFGSQHAFTIGYAIAIGSYFNVPDSDIKEAIAGLKPLAGRGALKKTGPASWVIDEAYNANPTSMSAAIRNVACVSSADQYQCYAVLGGMRELGASTKKMHAEILEMLGCFDKVVLFGSEWNGLKLPINAELCKTVECVIERALSFGMEKKLILVKGSNSYGLKRIVALLTEVADVRSLM